MREELIKFRGDRSQETMGKIYGVTQQQWSKYENGDAIPSPRNMLRLEKDSGVPMERLFFDYFQPLKRVNE